MGEENLIEAIIHNNPNAVAFNLRRLGIADINPIPSLIMNVIRNVRPEQGTELETISSILDVPIIAGNPGYEIILKNISNKTIIKGNLHDYFSTKEFQKNSNWESRIGDRRMMVRLISYIVVLFFSLLMSYLIFSLISKIISRQ